MFPEVNNQLQSVLIKKCNNIQLKINNETIKLFKSSNKAFEGMSDYKRTFRFNGGF